MNRRRFVGTAAGLAGLTGLSGCLSSVEFTITSTEIPDGNFASFLARDETDLSATQAKLVDELLANESAVRFAYEADDLLKPGTYVRAENAYYQMQRTDAGTETVVRDVLQAEAVTESEAAGKAVSYEQYTGPNERPVLDAVITAFRGHPVPHVFHSPANETPQLRPTLQHEYVEYMDEQFRLSLSETEVHVDQYEYSVTQMADDEQAFEAYLREDRDIIRLSSDELRAETAEVFDKITTTGRYRGSDDALSPFSQAETEVLEQLEISQKGSGTDTRYMSYDGSLYEVVVTWSHSD